MLHYINSKINLEKVLRLQDKMSEFYSKSDNYYENINFATSNWGRESEIAYQRILELCLNQRVAEVGCGEAAILGALSPCKMDYTGCDFSRDLMEQNQKKYPGAKFEVVADSIKLPLETRAYDVVFCVFVLEHVVQPECFIRELGRCCKKGGRLVIFCPDFAGQSRISSQLVGFSNGSGMEKIRKGQLLDGLLTGIMNKVVLPFYFKIKLRNADKDPVFLLNEKPACFFRPFYPDADAIYVTHLGEISKTLKANGFEIVENTEIMDAYNRRTRTLFIEAIQV